MDKSKWQIPCEEWLKKLEGEIREVKTVNDIAHYVKKITINNPNISHNDFLWWMDDSFIKNVISRLSRILEKENERFKDTVSFDIFLKKLKNNVHCIKSENEFVQMFGFDIDNNDSSAIKYLEDYKEQKRKEYIELTEGMTKEENIKNDIGKIEEYRKKFNGFRNYEVGHLKREKNYNSIEYKDVTEAIEFLEKLIRKYTRLIQGINPSEFGNYYYGNIFDIPWRAS